MNVVTTHRHEDTAHRLCGVRVQLRRRSRSTRDTDDTLASVTVVTLPAAGALELNSTAVTAGKVVEAADIVTLVFTPAY